MTAQGKVKFFDGKRGFGFIIPDGGYTGDMFFHHSAIVGGAAISDGQRVTFDVVDGRGGKQKAITVTPVNGSGSNSEAHVVFGGLSKFLRT